MPWSSFPMATRRAVFLAGYVLAALLAGAEIVVLGLALNPRVHPDYRAFYLDRTTTCLNRDRVGSLSPGETVSFRYLAFEPERMKRAEDMKVCGWTGPVGDGTHSLGEASRLRVKVTGVTGSLAATFVMDPVLRWPQTAQRVIISANGVAVHEATLTGNAPQEVSFVIPQTVLADAELLDIAFDYPDSIRQTPVASNIYDRAIKLMSFRLELSGVVGGIKSNAIDRMSAVRTPIGPAQ